MNKNVFDYLNGKAHDVADYIKAKAEAAGNYISDHAQDIKNGAIKTTATILTAAALVTGMTACNTNSSTTNPDNTPGISVNDPNYNLGVTLKPREEIEAEGIKAEDVIDMYNYFSLLTLHNLNEYTNMDNITAEFTNILPLKADIYYEEKDETVTITEPFYHTIDKDNYGINFNFLVKDNENTREYSSEVELSPATFEKLMNTFNVERFALTKKYWVQEIQDSSIGAHFNHAIMQYVYPPFEITKEIITNANDEQLWALYNAGAEITNQIEKNMQEREMN